ncbi:hypothetical protein L7F22_053122 [Adiantum nelumboides]|nr:hypothetical protein [Adiantum nelumboides]
MMTLRMLLALVATEDMKLDQMDVIIAFLHGNLEEDIYMQQPKVFAQKGKEYLVCKLLKSLYGLKQSSRQWYHKFDTFMRSLDYKCSNVDPCLYVERQPNEQLNMLILYVDDMLIASHSKKDIADLKTKLKSNLT